MKEKGHRGLEEEDVREAKVIYRSYPVFGTSEENHGLKF